MTVDPYILAFSAATVVVTIWMGFWSAKKSRTASDFFVAGRSVSVGWNASAISGEYLSAASFMGVAGMVMSSGYDALWYPVCYACGYLFLLLFIAGPLRRFGAYTIPDFAEGRFDSPIFRKIAVVFVLFIGFFYTMPQMKGAGTTLAYIFPGMPYWAGVVLVGAVITLNVALGGMKGITLVQAFQYWLKMFAISAPVFVLMAVYGHYGTQLGANQAGNEATLTFERIYQRPSELQLKARDLVGEKVADTARLDRADYGGFRMPDGTITLLGLLKNYGLFQEKEVYVAAGGQDLMQLVSFTTNHVSKTNYLDVAKPLIAQSGFKIVQEDASTVKFARTNLLVEAAATEVIRDEHPYELPGTIDELRRRLAQLGDRVSFDTVEDDRVGKGTSVEGIASNLSQSRSLGDLKSRLAYHRELLKGRRIWGYANSTATLSTALLEYSAQTGQKVFVDSAIPDKDFRFAFDTTKFATRAEAADALRDSLSEVGLQVADLNEREAVCLRKATLGLLASGNAHRQRKPLHDRAPRDATWISPFGPLTTKAAKAAAAALTNTPPVTLRPDLLPEHRMTVALEGLSVRQALLIYADITGREFLPRTNVSERLDELLNGTLSRLNLVTKMPQPDSGVFVHGDGMHLAADVKETVEQFFAQNGFAVVPEGNRFLRLEPRIEPEAKAREWLAKYERPLALLYTYSLIVALVCGTAGLPHILVRFYTNPDGVAAKRTTMWVMILIGVFYVFPPVFGVIGRNLLPDLYAASGAKGTDKIVLELPRILNDRYAPLGSILSGITCAGAFAAFMSTFSGLLVSMTGAMAHDVYGRILRPKSTPQERMRAFKIAAVVIGGVAVVLGMQVEPLQINFMVGQAFAIAAASYFPLLFMSAWWRGMTVKGAAAGMLAGGLLALVGISLTSFTDLGWIALQPFWAKFPLLRIICEQPAIWTVPLAIATMMVVSRATRRDIPADARMKMLVLHAPEKLGLKQEYIQEHQAVH